MGRANLPVRRVPPAEVESGDVVLLRWPWVSSSRWMLVEAVVEGVWFGRWAFGRDAGTWVVHAATDETYTVKHERDAKRDRIRVESLPRNT